MRKHFIFTDMSDESYYPAGAYNDPDAPWNEREIPERKFSVCVSQTLSKSTDITTNDYYIETGCPDADDRRGCVDEIDTSDTDWEKAYREGHYTPLELIRICGRLAEHVFDTNRYATGRIAGFSLRELLTIIDECDNWTEDEYDVGEE